MRRENGEGNVIDFLVTLCILQLFLPKTVKYMVGWRIFTVICSYLRILHWLTNLPELILGLRLFCGHDFFLLGTWSRYRWCNLFKIPVIIHQFFIFKKWFQLCWPCVFDLLLPKEYYILHGLLLIPVSCQILFCQELFRGIVSLVSTSRLNSQEHNRSLRCNLNGSPTIVFLV